ncbi:MAG: sensor histidine kinase [Opitutaceae bacterium]
MKLIEHPFIQAISDPVLRDSFISEVEVIEFQDGDTIFTENSAPDALFLILEGSVGFTKQRNDGTLQTVSHSNLGSFFGEVGVFTNEPRALGARALGDTRVGRAPEAIVKKIIEEAEPIRRILESVINHLKSTTDHYIHQVMRTEKLTLVGTMVSSLLHDFKNPFSIISLGASLIEQRHSDDAKTVSICQKIDSQIRRMVNMANDLAAFSKGESQIKVSQISLEHLFEEFKELNTPFAKDATVMLEMNANKVSLEADPGKLMRVLQNLINNAMEAMHSIEATGAVKVEATDMGDTITLSVCDSGPGIPKGIQSTLFEAFVTTGKREGTGLGTSIVKSIIDAHYGTITFETSAEGTCFTITLPKAHPVR